MLDPIICTSYGTRRKNLHGLCINTLQNHDEFHEDIMNWFSHKQNANADYL